jgi:hypothetical protein
MKRLSVAVLALAATALSAPAQDPGMRPEIRPFLGMYVPTGEQRDLFENAPIYGLQAALEFRPSFHLLGTFGYVPGQTKYAVTHDNVQILQYDIGFEMDMVRPLGDYWLFKPFFGLGAGARTYLYEADNLTNRTCTAGYGALGMELEYARTAIRFEGRDNLFCYKSPLPNIGSKTRNDIGLSLGIAYHFR